LGDRVSKLSTTRRAFLALAATVGAGCSAPLSVYLVRHAEKDVTGDKKDPPLSELGRRRAEALVTAFDGIELRAVFASEFKRTQLTVAPIAAARGLAVDTLAADDVRGLVDRVRALGGGALVAGHSNTVPEIAAALGLAEPIFIEEADYGDLFVVRATPLRATLERRRFDPA
jgi:phosphohistidine phosphatase SixA